jgi:hypothetical protein
MAYPVYFFIEVRRCISSPQVMHLILDMFVEEWIRFRWSSSNMAQVPFAVTRTLDGSILLRCSKSLTFRNFCRRGLIRNQAHDTGLKSVAFGVRVPASIPNATEQSSILPHAGVDTPMEDRRLVGACSRAFLTILRQADPWLFRTERAKFMVHEPDGKASLLHSDIDSVQFRDGLPYMP